MAGQKQYQIRLVSWGLFIALLFGAMEIHSQNRSVRFQHLSIEDGLPQNMIDCMLQDSQGFMWFGTWNGLSRYDGYTFESFNNDTALANKFIYSLYEGPFGNLWIGTRKGLYVYLYNEGKFIQVENQQLNGAIRTISRHGDSTALIASDYGLSLIQIKGAKAEFKVLKQLALGDKLQGSVVNDVFVDNSNHIWVATDQGVHIISEKGSGVRRLMAEASANTISSNNVLTLFQDIKGDVWMGTDYGLNKYNLSDQSIRQYFYSPTDPNTIRHNTVMDIVQDDKGNLLIATLGGLSAMSPEGKIINYVNEAYADHSLSNDFVNCLLKDNSGNIWIGTERGGINFYNTDQNVFEHFEFKADLKNSLSHATINSIYEGDEYLWIGTAGGGLNRYDRETDTYYHFKHDAANDQSISSNFITSIHRDRQGRLWSGAWGTGLNLLMGENSRKQYFKRYNGVDIPGTNTTFISSMEEDRDGNLWLGTLGGLVYFDIENEKFQPRFTSGNTKISEVGCLMFDKHGTLWVGTRMGLYNVDFQNGGQPIITKYKQGNDKHSLSGNYVISLNEGTDGTIWIGTYGHGVSQFDPGSRTFKHYNTSQGLSNNIVYTIEEDEYGKVWLSTDHGLSCYSPETNSFRNFYASDGLLNNQYYWTASYKNKQGKLYFGGMNGLDAFYPEWVSEGTHNPGVLITDIKLLNESVTPGKSYNDVVVINSNASKVDRINLSYKEKVFGVEFSSLNYREPDMVHYAYILEGFETDWNYVTSDRRYASYTNLKPGDYTFKVKASNSNGEFNEAAKEITIHIAPPFWATPWFRGLSFLFIAGLVVGYNRFRTYTLKRQKRILETQVKERTERINLQKEALSEQAEQLKHNNHQLEEKQKLIKGQNEKLEHQNKEILSQRDRLMALNKKLKLVSQLRLSFFTNVSHEFKTPLTLIIGPLEKLLKENRANTELHHTLHVMNRNAQRLLHLINQIMDFRKIEKGKMELKVTRGDLAGFCNNIFESFMSLSQLKNIEFTYEENHVPDEVWFDAEKCENILYNLLSNAFKYTPDGGYVKLEVQGLTHEESKLSDKTFARKDQKCVISMRISDSGIGISEENLPLVFKRFYRIESERALQIDGSGIGLSLTEELIKTHHGKIFVESCIGKGSTFEVQFPCLKGAYEASEITVSGDKNFKLDQQIAFLRDELLGTHEQSETKHKNVYNYEKNRPTVLVVEDNVDLRRFMALKLNETYNILEAGDGQEGIKLARKNDPDVIISDIMMPKMDGLEMCAYLKNHLDTCHIPVILLTAKGTIENQIEGLEIGADEYLPKPFSFELLAVRIQNLIQMRLKLKLKFIQSPETSAKEATTNSKDHQFLELAVNTVNENITDCEFGVSEFVKIMGISRSLLHKKLTSLTDQSASEFINHLRMKKAMHLLKQNELNVSEVAYAVGYNDPKYFTRLFSKYYGLSPKEYLKAEVITS